MGYLVPIGALVTLAGIAGLIACIVMVVRLRRAGLGEVEMKERLQRVVAYNLAALFISAIGLMAVVVGVILN